MTEPRSLSISHGLRAVLNDDKELSVYEEVRTTSLQTIHPNFAAEAEFDKQSSTYRPPQSSYLSEAFATFASRHPNLGDTECTWDNVIQVIENASAQDDSKSKSSKFVALSRNRVAPAILSQLVNIIPEEKGLNILRAGLGFVIETWDKRLHNRQRIFETLADIPGIFTTATQSWQRHRNDEELRYKVQDLCDALLAAISDLIQILNKSGTGSKASGAQRTRDKIVSWVPQIQGFNIDGILERVDRAKQVVMQRAGTLDSQRQTETHSNTVETLQNVKDIRKTAYSIQTNQKVQSAELIHHLKQSEERNKQNYQDANDDLRDSIVKMLTSFYHLAAEKKYKKDQMLPTIGYWGPIVQQTAGIDILLSHAFITRGQLMAAVQVPHGNAQDDLDKVLQLGASMNSESLGHARSLLRRVQFQRFMQSSMAGSLLIDGHTSDTCETKTSPVSVVMASLATVLSEYQAIITLHFFCSRHVRRDNPLKGPRGMMQSLIYQILLRLGQPEAVLDWMTEKALEGVRSADLGALCWVFREIVWSVQAPYAVVCIVDGATEFNSSLVGWSSEMQDVLAWFREMVAGGGGDGGPLFKVVVTSANKNPKAFYQAVCPTEYVSLEDGDAYASEKSQRAIMQDVRNAAGLSR